MDKEKKGKVYLIGAGPGDPKLLTLKAAEAIAQSDVVVYDYLVNPQILAIARCGVKLIYVGKQAGQPSILQEEINQILIKQANSGQIVARLKGGDPFIFGRGGEEAEALVDAGIKWEVIPGISSGSASATYAGIPLTHRHYASSVAFITGHNGKKSRKKVDWDSIANTVDTLVVFMCAETISNIADQIILGGRSAQTPIAIIRWGTYEYQEVYLGTLQDIANSEIKVQQPVIAIIGDVVTLKNKLHWFGNYDLHYSLKSLADYATETLPVYQTTNTSLEEESSILSDSLQNDLYSDLYMDKSFVFNNHWL
ncbi:MAG: uroporphyrinogen-III C-methyltransferase [Acidobacteria bacterium]|nr:uroporphyrinogen-III C-methyltransferase [Acidobacteriota bacterium]